MTVTVARERVTECGAIGCSERAVARGYCNRHYQRLIHHGDPNYQPVRKTMQERFWEKVSPTGFCWEWVGALDTNGYGAFNTGPRIDRAHRVSYELLISPIPEGLVIDHLCRNRKCCNPDHLETVTAAENCRRAESPTHRTARTGRCQRGHSMDDAYIRPDTGTRMCRECQIWRGRNRERT